MIQERQFQQLQRSVLVRHFDAGETLFLERELTQLRARVMEVLFPMLKARTFLPKATDIAASAETYSYKVIKPIGKARIVSYQANDLPRVDVTAEEVLGKVRPLGAAFGWDINELREAARLNIGLADLKAKTAREIIERGIDEIIAFGNIAQDDGVRPDASMAGLVNNSLITANGVSSGSYYLGGAVIPANIIAELTSVINSVNNTSKQLFVVNTYLLPVPVYNYLAQTPYSTLNGESILTVLQENNKNVNFEAWYQLSAAGASSSYDRGIAYMKDTMTAESVVPQEFEQMPPEVKGLEMINNCHARSGGTKVYQPLAFKYIDFATS